MGHIHEGFEKGRGSRSPDQRPFRPPRMCKQRHVDPDLGDAPTPHPTGTASRGGGGRSRETAARQGDPTAFLAGVSAPLPVPVAEISDLTPELGRSPFRERLAFQSEGSVREGDAFFPPGIVRRFRSVGETPGRRLCGLRDYNSHRTRGGEAPDVCRVRCWGLQSQPWALLLGNPVRIQPALFTDGQTEAQRPEGRLI